MTEPVAVGIDAGGTKTHVLVSRGPAIVRDLVIPTTSWWPANASIEDPANASRLLAAVALGAADRADERACLVLGAHGIDSLAQAAAVKAALGAGFAGRVLAVNDALLAGPAAGYPGACIAVVAGTGSIVVGTAAGGDVTRVGGHGHLLGDEGSAPALVRDTARELLRLADSGGSDLAAEDALCAAAGIAGGPERLTELSTWLHAHPSRTDWGALAPSVFVADAAGSPIAAAVIDRHADRLGELVSGLVRDGLEPAAVVLLGGVVVHQPRLADGIARSVHRTRPDVPVLVLSTPPAHGALAMALARRRGVDQPTGTRP